MKWLTMNGSCGGDTASLVNARCPIAPSVGRIGFHGADDVHHVLLRPDPSHSLVVRLTPHPKCVDSFADFRCAAYPGTRE